MATRDKNDARVTFTTLAQGYGLSAQQGKNLWRALQPPFPTAQELADRDEAEKAGS